MLINRIFSNTDRGVRRVIRDILQRLRKSLRFDDPAKIAYESGVFHMHGQRFEAALQELERALELEPDYWQATIYKGMILKRTGRVKEALALMSEVIRKHPECEEAHYNRACYRCLLDCGADGIIEDLRTSFRLYPPARDAALVDPDLAPIRAKIDNSLR